MPVTVVRGSSLPPGVDGATRGEVSVRVEELALDSALLPNHNGAALDSLCVVPAWWGSADVDSPTTTAVVSCVPPTPRAPSRPSTSFAFPIKTVRSRLEQYLRDAPAGWTGLRCEVHVPWQQQCGGKPIAVAEVRLADVTPAAPVAGYFNVVATATNKWVGCIKLHVSVNYGDAAVAPPRRTAAATAATTGPNASPPSASTLRQPTDNKKGDDTSAAAASSAATVRRAVAANRHGDDGASGAALLQQLRPLMRELADAQCALADALDHNAHLTNRVAELSSAADALRQAHATAEADMTTLRQRAEAARDADRIVALAFARADACEAELQLVRSEHEARLEEDLCCVCQDAPRDVALVPCGHRFCRACVPRLVRCALCNAVPQSRLRLL